MKLSSYCDEFLIHAVDVEGESQRIEEKELVCLLARGGENSVTYAENCRRFEDLRELKRTRKRQIECDYRQCA